ncbi:MAG: hypothetical protein AAFU53_00075 [Cyanobacteria bacterium J06632_3]
MRLKQASTFAASTFAANTLGRSLLNVVIFATGLGGPWTCLNNPVWAESIGKNEETEISQISQVAPYLFSGAASARERAVSEGGVSPEVSQAYTLMSEQESDRIRHRLPIDAIHSMLEVRAESDDLQTLQIFEIEEQEKDAFTFSLRRPLVRTAQSEFSLSLGLSYLDESLGSIPSQPQLPSPPPPGERFPPPGEPSPPPRNGPELTRSQSVALPNPPAGPNPPAAMATADSIQSDSMHTGVFQFSQNYRSHDRGGQWSMRSQFNLGTELANSPDAMNADAQFFSWTGRLERTQHLNDNNQLTLQLETQLSPNNLLPPHQFKMKDRQFDVFERDARPSQIAGNNGIRVRLADRVALVQDISDGSEQGRRQAAPILALIPFVDLGYAWGQSNPGMQIEQFLGRAGLGLSVQPSPELNIQIDYLNYWGDLQPGDSTQDLYMTFSYRHAW